MGDFSSLLSLIVWIGVIIVIFNKIKNKRGRNTDRTVGKAVKRVSNDRGGHVASSVKRASAAYDATQKDMYSASRKGRKKSSNIASIMEDRNHDWLAKQLAEERIAYFRTSAMFDLKMSHAANCDAAKLRDQHERSCDAGGVDTAKP